MAYRIIDTGESASFPQAHDFLAQAHASGEGRVYLGAQAGQRYRQEQAESQQAPFVAIELDLECLGVHTGDDDDGRARNVVGFARFRLGDEAPTRLIELVHKPYTSPEALQAARAAFDAAGLEVAVCNDFPGRILNRLVRPTTTPRCGAWTRAWPAPMTWTPPCAWAWGIQKAPSPCSAAPACTTTTG